jgi:hypothetical protein
MNSTAQQPEGHNRTLCKSLLVRGRRRAGMVGRGANRQRKRRICGAEGAARPAVDLFYQQRGATVDGEVASGGIGGSLPREEGGCAKGESAAAFGPFLHLHYLLELFFVCSIVM